MSADERYMERALSLALMGVGQVSPNPLVGCVVVHNDRIIGEGWHQRFGEAHAEVNAVSSVNDKSLLKQSTVYVNLEPCSHHGKTPPCADMLVAQGVQRVVVANLDTNPKVSGKGIHKLREAGIQVATGVLEKEGRWLNRRFFGAIENKRPYVVLKWAQTADGFIARENMESKWISDVYARQLVHRWRAEEDAVLVGARTATHDNPMLNVRDWSGRNPTRILIDRFLRIPHNFHLFDKTQLTLCFNVLRHEEHAMLKYIRVSEEKFLGDVMEYCYTHGIHSIMVEGGAFTIARFIEAGWWDEARIFTSPKSFGKGIPAPVLHGKLISETQIVEDRLSVFVPGH